MACQLSSDHVSGYHYGQGGPMPLAVEDITSRHYQESFPQPHFDSKFNHTAVKRLPFVHLLKIRNMENVCTALALPCFASKTCFLIWPTFSVRSLSYMANTVNTASGKDAYDRLVNISATWWQCKLPGLILTYLGSFSTWKFER